MQIGIEVVVICMIGEYLFEEVVEILLPDTMHACMHALSPCMHGHSRPLSPCMVIVADSGDGGGGGVSGGGAHGSVKTDLFRGEAYIPGQTRNGGGGKLKLGGGI